MTAIRAALCFDLKCFVEVNPILVVVVAAAVAVVVVVAVVVTYPYNTVRNI